MKKNIQHGWKDLKMDIGSNVTNTGPYIETVRSLHQTVTALRTALEESKKEILHLKTKVWPIDTIEQSLTALAIENHALRRKLLEGNDSAGKPPEEKVVLTKPSNNEVNTVPPLETTTNLDNLQANSEVCTSELEVGDSLKKKQKGTIN